MEDDGPLLLPTKVIPPGWKSQAVTEYCDGQSVSPCSGAIFVKSKTQLDSTHWSEATKYFDTAGRTVRTEQQDSGGNIRVDTQYDALGRPWKTSNPYRTGGTPVWTVNGYDELGRMTTVTTPDSAVVSTAFRLHTGTTDGIPLGTMTLVTDQANIKRLALTDAGGNMTDVWEIKSSDNDTVSVTFDSTTTLAGYRTSYRYDIAGRLHEVQQGSQHRYFAYDPLGRLVRAKNVEQQTNSSLPALTDPISTNSAWAQGYTYDPNGNLLVTTTARNSTITNTYDALNRVTLRDYSGSMPDVDYRYDTVTNGLGKPASVSNGLVTTRYTEYSAVGELLQSQQEFDGVAAPYAFRYAYNMAGQMVTETYPSGRVVMNTFDAEGKVDSVSSRGAGHAPHIFANGFHYNDKGVMDRLRLGNGLWEGRTVNNRYQPIQITLGTSSGGSELLKLDYNYGSAGNNGNVQSQTITVPTIGTATGFVTTQAYYYDALDRLASVEEKQYGITTPDWRQQFGYDPYGNRAMGTASTQTFGRNSTETPSLIGPDPTVSTSTNRITNRTGEHYEFDASGNMTKDALGNRSVYDIENHQTEYYYSTNSGSTPDAKYYYDGDGKRIKKVVGTETTVFVYDATGKLVAEYTLGVTASPSPQTNYITTDTLGSPRLVTNGSGQVVARHDYLPFGDEIYGLGGRTSAQGFSHTDTTRKRFTGYEHDAETGLEFAQARYYGNGLGRFTGVDPLLESAKAGLPQSWNRYSYCINNPANLADPTGLGWEIWVDGSRSGPVYRDNGAPNRWTEYIYRVTAQVRGQGKWVALDPWSGKSSMVGTKAEAQAAFRGFQNTHFADFGKGVANGSGVTALLDFSLTGSVPGMHGPLESIMQPSEQKSGFYNLGIITGNLGAYGVAEGGPAAFNQFRGMSVEAITNPVPRTMARVIPDGIEATSLGRPGEVDVFVTASEDIQGMNAGQITDRLSLQPGSPSYQVIEFPTPTNGVASPVFRANRGFVGGGRTAGGAREFVIPNGPIPPGATIRKVQ
jgi:RHS repeat-associated protein